MRTTTRAQSAGLEAQPRQVQLAALRATASGTESPIMALRAAAAYEQAALAAERAATAWTRQEMLLASAARMYAYSDPCARTALREARAAMPDSQAETVLETTTVHDGDVHAEDDEAACVSERTSGDERSAPCLPEESTPLEDTVLEEDVPDFVGDYDQAFYTPCGSAEEIRILTALRNADERFAEAAHCAGGVRTPPGRPPPPREIQVMDTDEERDGIREDPMQPAHDVAEWRHPAPCTPPELLLHAMIEATAAGSASIAEQPWEMPSARDRDRSRSRGRRAGTKQHETRW